MRGSVRGLWGAGAGGARMFSLRMESKWEDRECRPGSMLMEGERALMKMASLMPLLTQPCSSD